MILEDSYLDAIPLPNSRLLLSLTHKKYSVGALDTYSFGDPNFEMEIFSYLTANLLFFCFQDYFILSH